jgi:hypothetical protein
MEEITRREDVKLDKEEGRKHEKEGHKTTRKKNEREDMEGGCKTR